MITFKNTYKDKIIMLIAPVLFYVFFCFFDGAIICVDSPSYIDMTLSREPFYPAFLALNRLLFGEGYLQIAVLWQSLLMAYAIYRLCLFLKREFELPLFMGLFFEVICIATSLLCRFVAQRGSMYSNSIMTESICIPLFLLFSVYALNYLFAGGSKALIGASICSFIMISTRKQMYISIVLLLMIVVYVHIIKKKTWRKGLLCTALVIVAIMGANKGFEYAYHYAIHGETVSHFNDNRFLATMIFFVAEREDAEYIEDESIRELFQEILTICTESGYTRSTCTEQTLRGMTSFFADHYDHIQIDTMWPMIETFSAKRISDSQDHVAREIMTDQVTSEIIANLLPHTFMRIVEVFWGSCIHGYFNTVAKDHPMINIFSIILGILYCMLQVVHMKRDFGRGTERSLGELSKTSLLGLYVMAAVVLNIVVVAMVIFCQTRYMIYNMPLFYIALFVLLWKGIEGRETHVKTN